MQYHKIPVLQAFRIKPGLAAGRAPALLFEVVYVDDELKSEAVFQVVVARMQAAEIAALLTYSIGRQQELSQDQSSAIQPPDPSG